MDNITVDTDSLFTNARSHYAWQDHAVPDQLLVTLYDLAKSGPTSMNCSPARLLFLRTEQAKTRLLPHLTRSNQEKAQHAPVVAVIAHDLRFYEYLPTLFPVRPDAKSLFESSPAQQNHDYVLRNSSLQGAYLILAARALGLDCGPMSGFDAEGVNREFFQGTSVVSNFLCALGYADRSRLAPKLPRLAFSEVCTML